MVRRNGLTVNRHILTGYSAIASNLTSRLVGCLPAATIEMEALCRLAGIKISREIPTAAVEVLRRPRLLINPDFADKYCQRDEHLFLLVMHELWHIILAHTRLYPRVTPAHNVAFDAIINAGLARAHYAKPEYRGFFEALNPADKFPSMLLRPPVGWPQNPEYPTGGPSGTRQIIERLYPPPGSKQVSMPFYEEILQLLRQYAEENGYVWIEGDPFLLGDHDNPDAEASVFDDPVLNETMRKLAKELPGNMLSKRPGKGGSEDDKEMQVDTSAEQARRAFSHILKRCLGPRRGGHKRRAKTPIVGISGTSVLPNARDRLAPARRKLGVPGTIWQVPATVRVRLPEEPSKAHVYLDVSGSMNEVLPHLLGMLVPYVRSGQAEVFQFSTIVSALPLEKLEKGRLNTSGGTNINCVINHLMAAKPNVRRALILTDGMTGTPSLQNLERVRERNARLHVVLPAENAHEDDLRQIATTMITLPPLWSAGADYRPNWKP